MGGRHAALPSPQNRRLIVAFLEEVASSDAAANRNFARQVLQEWWLP
jgi:hypothetical protein